MWRSDSAAAVWLMPAGGAAWMVVWIMLGPCAVPLVHVVRYYPFWSIVVSVVTSCIVAVKVSDGNRAEEFCLTADLALKPEVVCAAV